MAAQGKTGVRGRGRRAGRVMSASFDDPECLLPRAPTGLADVHSGNQGAVLVTFGLFVRTRTFYE